RRRRQPGLPPAPRGASDRRRLRAQRGPSAPPRSATARPGPARPVPAERSGAGVRRASPGRQPLALRAPGLRAQRLAAPRRRRTQLLKGLPATSTVEENAAAGVTVYTFNVTVSPLSSEDVAVLPTILNSNPLAKAFVIEPKGNLEFQVVTTGNPVLDYETMPNRVDLQIFVEDTTGRTDLNILTVQVTDKNEHPVFQGNMAIQIFAAPCISAILSLREWSHFFQERI
uniref:Cadherin domain-containing protein n=1 Tax=Strigops habroptila TaxID=2489341 RepID=A0A672UD65_STRHB